MPPAVPDGTACDFDRSRLPASRAAVFGETADVGNKRLDSKSQIRRQKAETGSSFSAAYQRFDDGPAANCDAISGERIEEIVKQRVKNLLGERLLSGQSKTHGQFLRDGEAHRIRNRAAATVGLISQR